jgi:hypothetical protein
MRQEIIGLKRALADTVKFLECNQSLIEDFFSVVSARHVLNRTPNMYFLTYIMLGGDIIFST